MRKHTILTTVLSACAYLALYGQTPNLQSCYYDTWMSSIKMHHPEYFDAYEEQYNQALLHAQASEPRNNTPIYTIPVVVHIVWKEEQEYLSDKRIKAQLEQLNEDFSTAYLSSHLLRPSFEAVVEDPRIQFELVHVERVYTDSLFRLGIDWSTLTLAYPDQVKDQSKGGSDAWDTERYLNIWVCGIHEDQLLGYAYPPTGFDQWPGALQAPETVLDGVVINYKAFGKLPPSIPGNNGTHYQPHGHTLSHEVGHYLGLRHPWGLEEFSHQPCDADDGLGDTPLVAGPQAFQCDYQLNSCIEQPNDLPDMIENFMDYSSEDCRTAFTQGQIQLMHYVLDKYRPQLRQKTIEINKKSPFKLYPNPSQGTVQVFINPDFPEEYELTIVGADSRILDLPNAYYPASSFAQYQVNLSTLPNGVYFVQLRSPLRRLSQRVVLMR